MNDVKVLMQMQGVGLGLSVRYYVLARQRYVNNKDLALM